MRFSFTPQTARDLKRIKKKQPQLFRKIQKQLSIFGQNYRHPSLRTHKLKGKLTDYWSISIEGNLRMIYYLRKDEAVFFLIGTHDEVYKR